MSGDLESRFDLVHFAKIRVHVCGGFARRYPVTQSEYAIMCMHLVFCDVPFVVKTCGLIACFDSSLILAIGRSDGCPRS